MPAPVTPAPTNPAPVAPPPANPAPAPTSSPRRGLRGRWSDDHFTLEWMLVALVTSAMALIAPRIMAQPLWTPIHAVALGVVSNGIFQWSWFFSRGLLHFPVSGIARYGTFVRIVVLNVGIVALFVAMWSGSVVSAVIATVLICGAGLHQGIVLAVLARRYRENRFAPIVRYYSVAFFFFTLTGALGALLAYEMMAGDVPPWLVARADGIAVAHSVLGVGGWAGLTILATVVTLGLSMLHARQSEVAWSAAAHALPFFVAGILVACVGAVADIPVMVGAGVLVFLVAGVGGILRPLMQSFRLRKRSSHAVWPLLSGLAWLVLLLAVFAVESLMSADVTALRDVIISQLGIFLAASVGQVFVASLEYLVPVAIGGGPTIQRVGDIAVSFQWPVRWLVRNVALALVLVVQMAGGASGVWASAVSADGTMQSLQTLLFVVVLICYGVDLVLVAFGAVRQLAAKKKKAAAAEMMRKRKAETR